LSIRPFWVIAAVAIVARTAAAQVGAPVPVITPAVESSAIHAGGIQRLAVRVALPRGNHVQSNKPRDPSLIPTELRLTPPDGIKLEEIVFPPSAELKVAGLPEMLAVFEENFDIGVQLAVGVDRAPGSVSVPARLRYQACNETMCFPPKTVSFEWTFSIVPPSAKSAKGNPELFNSIRFGHGERPEAGLPPTGGALPQPLPPLWPRPQGSTTSF